MQPKVGIAINLGVVFGITVNNAFGLILPELPKNPTEEQTKAAMDDNLWRVSYSLQLVPTVITTVLWLLFFKTEPV